MNRQLHVIVIEDDPTLRRALTDQINNAPGMQAVEAATAMEGARLAQQERQGVALIDLTLPDATSLDALVFLRQTSPGLVRIVLTGAEMEVQQAALKAGAHCVIQKGGPYSYGKALEQTIRNTVAQYEESLRFAPAYERQSRIEEMAAELAKVKTRPPD